MLACLLLTPALCFAASQSTADHGKFEELQGPFTRGEEVTKACLGCHTEAARQVMATTHSTCSAPTGRRWASRAGSRCRQSPGRTARARS
jgi:hypothetical protein